MSGVDAFLGATVRTATPLLLASLGEAVTECSGLINISLEGSIIAGAFGAFVAAPTFGVGMGYAAGIAAGAAIGILFAVFVVALHADQIVTGTALTMGALGLTGTLFRLMPTSAAALAVIPTSGSYPFLLLTHIPWLGPALFVQPLVTYVGYALIPCVWWWLYRTHSGLGIRAVGDAPHAAIASGVRVHRARTVAVLFGSSLGGLAGATLVLAQAGTFAEGMSAGRGFIAIAIVALGRWRPIGVAIAALIFGAAMAVQFVVQALGWHVRYELVLMVPYLLTLAGLVLAGRARAPLLLGRTD